MSTSLIKRAQKVIDTPLHLITDNLAQEMVDRLVVLEAAAEKIEDPLVDRLIVLERAAARTEAEDPNNAYSLWWNT
ncbi:hypothetical protein GD1_164 [Paraglaciecola Antarctic GD virus 1]|nr:hypothetical protein GD1_164 [Paraglaciecola Antarctic GD virus 1]